MIATLILRPSRKWFHVCSRRAFSQQLVKENDVVLLQAINNPRATPTLTKPLLPGEIVQFPDNKWKLNADDIIGKPIRHTIESPKKTKYRICKPTLSEYTTLSPRIVTPIYPQDANLIVSLLDLNPSVPQDSNGVENHERIEIFEAGTGHGALTLHLARAIHAANKAPPPIPRIITDKEIGSVVDSVDVNDSNITVEKEKEIYAEWRANRRAVIHTLDSSPSHSKHAEKTVKNFRNGIYYPNIDFHVGNITEYLSQRLSETRDVFLDHAILDLPGTHHEMEIISKCMKPNGILITFCPSITQITSCVHTVKDKNLPFFLETALELGSALATGGREWEIRSVKPRALLKAEAEARKAKVLEQNEITDTESQVAIPNESMGMEDGDIEDAVPRTVSIDSVDKEKSTDSSQWELICRPKVGERIRGGGFIGVWRKIEQY